MRSIQSGLIYAPKQKCADIAVEVAFPPNNPFEQTVVFTPYYRAYVGP